MTTHNESFWGDLSQRPTFILTADQDWAPESAMDVMLDLVGSEGVPLHLFVTNDSAAVDSRCSPEVTTGIHPNFLPGSTHGATGDAVLDTCLALCPDATTFRSHSLMESSQILQLLVSRGIRADSNLCLYLQPDIVPLLHAHRLLRFPIFLQDDVFFRFAGLNLDIAALREQLLTPGLKIFNFHPAHVALNTPTLPYYEANRNAFYGGDDRLTHQGRGIRDVLVDLVSLVRNAGHEFTSFPDLVESAQQRLIARFPSGLAGWLPA